MRETTNRNHIEGLERRGELAQTAKPIGLTPEVNGAFAHGEFALTLGDLRRKLRTSDDDNIRNGPHRATNDLAPAS